MEGINVTEDNCSIGMEVVRGKDWKWNSQDVFPGNVGVITENKWDTAGNIWVKVKWKKNNEQNVYRVGPDHFDLMIYNSNVIHELW